MSSSHAVYYIRVSGHFLELLWVYRQDRKPPFWIGSIRWTFLQLLRIRIVGSFLRTISSDRMRNPNLFLIWKIVLFGLGWFLPKFGLVPPPFLASVVSFWCSYRSVSVSPVLLLMIHHFLRLLPPVIQNILHPHHSSFPNVRILSVSLVRVPHLLVVCFCIPVDFKNSSSGGIFLSVIRYRS